MCTCSKGQVVRFLLDALTHVLNQSAGLLIVRVVPRVGEVQSKGRHGDHFKGCDLSSKFFVGHGLLSASIVYRTIAIAHRVKLGFFRQSICVTLMRSYRHRCTALAMLTFISRERSWCWNTLVLAFTISIVFDDFRSLSETRSLYGITGTFRSFGCSVKPCS